VFGCPMQGDIAQDEVLEWVDRFAQLDVHGVTLCDTTGMAYPTQVGDLFAAVLDRFAQLQVTAHFHNTRGMALANTVTALQAGVLRFDSSLGGLGGCPYAPGASGNATTEDLVHMLELMGYDTGVNLDGILAISRTLAPLIGHDVNSQTLAAGARMALHPIPEYVRQLQQAQ
ncbi:MAG: hydroxymethylglutaryl-CoA lyase, partial [Advenella sp.]